MSTTINLNPKPKEAARAAESEPQPTRSRRRSIPCSRCRAPLYYSAGKTRRGATLYCNRCGSPTSAPTARMRLLKIATAIFAAGAIGVLAYAIKHKGPPTLPLDERVFQAGAPEE